MAKTVSISLSAVIVFGLVFLAACGFIVFQNVSYGKLFQEHIDLMWTSSNDAADLVYVRKNLENCLGETVP